MAHEALRDQLAETILTARLAARRLHAARVLAERRDCTHQVRHAGAAGSDSLDDRRPPFTRCITMQRQVGFDGRDEAVGAFPIRLVHDEDVGDLRDASLERLHGVATAGDERDDRQIGGADDVDFVLADADGLDDDDRLAGRVEDDRRVAGRARQAAEMAARAAEVSAAITDGGLPELPAGGLVEAGLPDGAV